MKKMNLMLLVSALVVALPAWCGDKANPMPTIITLDAAGAPSALTAIVVEKTADKRADEVKKDDPKKQPKFVPASSPVLSTNE